MNNDNLFIQWQRYLKKATQKKEFNNLGLTQPLVESIFKIIGADSYKDISAMYTLQDINYIVETVKFAFNKLTSSKSAEACR